MSEQNNNIVQRASKRRWSVTASIYIVWALTFFLSEYLYILLTIHRRGVPLGLIMGVGLLSYFVIPAYIIIGLCSIPYWIINRKANSIRAAIPLFIVCATVILYVLYVIFAVPHINGGGAFYRFILYEIERAAS